MAKLNPAGSALVYSTYLGGSGDDAGYGIAVDCVRRRLRDGQHRFRPTSRPSTRCRPRLGGRDDDAFVAKLNPAGSALVYSTYLGGSDEDGGDGIAVDAAGNAYVTGFTAIDQLPDRQPAAAWFRWRLL